MPRYEKSSSLFLSILGKEEFLGPSPHCPPHVVGCLGIRHPASDIRNSPDHLIIISFFLLTAINWTCVPSYETFHPFFSSTDAGCFCHWEGECYNVPNDNIQRCCYHAVRGIWRIGCSARSAISNMLINLKKTLGRVDNPNILFQRNRKVNFDTNANKTPTIIL